MAIWSNYITFRHHFSTSLVIDPLTGYEEWPLAMVRANGFTDLALPRPILVASFKLTVNPLTPGDPDSGADDAVAHVDEYNWYVSQRTDVAARQHLTVSQVTNKSGTLQFDITANAEEMIPALTDPLYVLTELDLHLLYRNVWVYCQRIGDDAIQQIELLTASTADL